MGALNACLSNSYQAIELKREGELSPEPVPLDHDSKEHREVVISKAVRALEQIEKAGELRLQRDSVYGAVIAMPQLARSAAWNVTFTALALRSLLLYLINLTFQFFLAYMVYNAGYNYFTYAGKMHLCSFGAGHTRCPHGQNCYGPGGTTYTPERLYSFDIWSTRNFVRDSLAQVFPDMQRQIEDQVDPGEYGLESLSCRLICAFIFCMVVMDDLASTVELVQLLYYLPNQAESWIAYDYSEKIESTGRRSMRKSDVKMMNDWREKDLVKFKIRGMPPSWKLFNLIFVVVPKLMIWKAVAYVGVYYLFETAGIMDLIINTTALAFLLSLDELIQKYFAATSMQHVMQSLECLRLRKGEGVEHESDQETVKNVRAMRRCTLHNLLLIFPKQLIATVALLAMFSWEYYHSNCVATEDGSMISTNIREPHRNYNWWCMFVNCKNYEGDLIWRMPNVSYPYVE